MPRFNFQLAENRKKNFWKRKSVTLGLSLKHPNILRPVGKAVFNTNSNTVHPLLPARGESRGAGALSTASPVCTDGLRPSNRTGAGSPPSKQAAQRVGAARQHLEGSLGRSLSCPRRKKIWRNAPGTWAEALWRGRPRAPSGYRGEADVDRVDARAVRHSPHRGPQVGPQRAQAAPSPARASPVAGAAGTGGQAGAAGRGARAWRAAAAHLPRTEGQGREHRVLVGPSRDPTGPLPGGPSYLLRPQPVRFEETGVGARRRPGREEITLISRPQPSSLSAAGGRQLQLTHVPRKPPPSPLAPPPDPALASGLSSRAHAPPSGPTFRSRPQSQTRAPPSGPAPVLEVPLLDCLCPPPGPPTISAFESDPPPSSPAPGLETLLRAPPHPAPPGASGL
ncbi:laforin-like [Lepus europaeus]|uniref:laforin-like n=1 Tax=Lepus europaeus TaxID=9983 RepID=UPI002B468683|nr:laforin-like [Lepus europaeus]